MNIKCDKCSKDALIYLAYGKHNFCKDHFNDFFESRFKKTIRQFKLFSQKDYLGVATSGGKDSMVLLYLINKIFKEKRIKFCAIFVDEGTDNYSNKTFQVVKDFCSKENIKLVTSSHKKEFDISTQEIGEKYDKKEGTVCTYCGVLRRKTLNRLANKENVSKLLTGHNLDDECQTILMNLLDNDTLRFFRTGPETGIIEIEDTIPRIKPFYLTPEKEIAAYALFNQIPFHDCNCPFFRTAKRNHFRNFLNETEIIHPGSKFSLIKSFLKIKEYSNLDKIITKKNLKKCKICKEDTSQDICKACELISKIKNI
jgi:uncharacterized protein (TIGR00269 family)